MALPASTPEQALRIREKSGLSQTAFGKAFGVWRATVQRWEVSGMPPLEYHQAQMLYDDAYVAKWIAEQVKAREGLWPAIQRKVRAVL